VAYGSNERYHRRPLWKNREANRRLEISGWQSITGGTELLLQSEIGIF
jgi:hypothetical protein